jgi:hypothetical protein
MGLFDNDSDIFGMEVTERAKSIFLNMARWTKFLAIMGFIFIGLMLLMFSVGLFTNFSDRGFSSNPVLSSIGVGGSMIFAVLLLGIYFYPTYTLYMYSIKIKRAVLSSDKDQFETALNFLKNTFQYLAILLIIVLIMYGLILAVALMFISRL